MGSKQGNFCNALGRLLHSWAEVVALLGCCVALLRSCVALLRSCAADIWMLLYCLVDVAMLGAQNWIFFTKFVGRNFVRDNFNPFRFYILYGNK